MSTQRELFEATNKIPYSTEFSEIMCRYVTKNTELTDQIIQARWEGWQKAVKANNIDTANYKDTIRKLEAEVRQLSGYRQIADPAIGFARLFLSEGKAAEALGSLDKTCEELRANDKREALKASKGSTES